jgi:hypothetical protein
MNLKITFLVLAMVYLVASEDQQREKRTIGAIFNHFSGFLSAKTVVTKPPRTTPKPQVPTFSLNSLFHGLDFFQKHLKPKNGVMPLIQFQVAQQPPQQQQQPASPTSGPSKIPLPFPEQPLPPVQPPLPVEPMPPASLPPMDPSASAQPLPPVDPSASAQPLLPVDQSAQPLPPVDQSAQPLPPVDPSAQPLPPMDPSAMPSPLPPVASAGPTPAVDVTINVSSELPSNDETAQSNSEESQQGYQGEGSFSQQQEFPQQKGFSQSFNQDFSFPQQHSFHQLSSHPQQKSFSYQNFPQKQNDYRYTAASYPSKFDSHHNNFDFHAAPLQQNVHQYVEFAGQHPQYNFHNDLPSAQYLPTIHNTYSAAPTYNNYDSTNVHRPAHSHVKMPHSTYDHVTYHDEKSSNYNNPHSRY